MRNYKNRLLAWFMSVLVLFGSIPYTAYADQTSDSFRIPRDVVERSVSVNGTITGVKQVTRKADGTFEAKAGSTYSITADALVDEKISLGSPKVKTVTEDAAQTQAEVPLSDHLYYLSDSTLLAAPDPVAEADVNEVEYLKLNKKADDAFELLAFGSSDTPLNTGSNGVFLLVTAAEDATAVKMQIYPISVTEKMNGTAPGLTHATLKSSEPFEYTCKGLTGVSFSLKDVTGSKEFYYGSITNETDFDLKKCTSVIIDKEGVLRPLGENQQPVENVSLYMVYDHQYSFDVTLKSIVNEHSEDNGDVYLWKGTVAYKGAGVPAAGADESGSNFTHFDAEKTQISEVKTVTLQGHIGDSFTAKDVLGEELVYAAASDQSFEAGWFNVHDHASDGGTRDQNYAFKDYLKLNTFKDKVNYFEICESNGSAELKVRTPNEPDYLSDGVTLYTTRPAVARLELYPKLALNHIQLRVPSAVTMKIKDEEGKDVLYSGDFTLVKATASVYYNDKQYLKPGTELKPENSTVGDQQESQRQTFLSNKTISLMNNGNLVTDVFNSDSMKIHIEYEVTGTLRGTNGKTIEINAGDARSIYKVDLSSADLEQAYKACPNQCGFDIMLNIAEAIKQDITNESNIILTKVWDDNQNEKGIRPDAVTVVLQRSADGGQSWEGFENNKVTITGEMQDSIWKKDLAAIEGFKTFITNTDGSVQQYKFKIVAEEGIPAEKTVGGEKLKYTTDISADGGTVTNSLHLNKNITVKKVWRDENGNALTTGIPSSVNVVLYQDGGYYDMKTLSQAAWECTFENLPYQTGTKTHTYTVYELSADGVKKAAGDSVTFNGKDYMISIGTSGDTTTITNRLIHKAVNLTGTKAVENISSPAGFKFDLFKVEGSTENKIKESVTLDNGTFSFPLEYSLSDMGGSTEKTFTYRVKEDISGTTTVGGKKVKDNVYYDTKVINVTVKAAYNASSGAISITEVKAGISTLGATTVNGVTTYDITGSNNFLNYTPEKTEAVIQVTKAFNGLDASDKNFTFTLAPQTGSEEGYSNAECTTEYGTKTTTTTGAETGTFTKIYFKEVGTYTYILSENSFAASEYPGYGRDQSQYEVTFTVTEANKKLNTAVTYKQIKKADGTDEAAGTTPVSLTEPITFTNTFAGANYQIPVAKQITGWMATENSDKVFTFRLASVSGDSYTGDTYAANTSFTSEDVQITGKGNTYFDTLYFKTPGTYTYKLTEQEFTASAYPGYTRDQSEYTVEIVVAERAGALSVTSATWQQTKNQNGEAVSNAQKQPMTVGSTTGTIPTFDNKYEVTATSYQLPVHKTVEGKDNDTKTFSFTLTGVAGANGTGYTDAEGTTAFTDAVQSVTAGTTGLFNAIHYTAAGTYEYTLKEAALSTDYPGYTGDQSEYQVTVEVVDDNSQLKVDRVIYQQTKGSDGTAITNPRNVSLVERGTVIENRYVPFTNTYDAADTTFELPVTKAFAAFEGQPALAEGWSPDREFTFSLTPTSANTGFLDQDKEEPFTTAQTVTVEGKNTEAFPTIYYNAEGTYTYTLKEENFGTGYNGFGKDASEYTITVVVNDINGQLTAAATYKRTNDTGNGTDIPAVTGVTFTNTYRTTGTSYQLPVTKAITGLPEGAAVRDFIFTLSAGTGETGYTSEEYTTAFSSETATVHGAATELFESIYYNKAGSYNYVLSENDLTAAAQPGYSKDPKVYAVTVTVEDVDSQLTVTNVTYTQTNVTDGGTAASGTVSQETNSSGITFTNNYRAADVSLELPVAKTTQGISNDRAEDKTFLFDLYAADSSYTIGENAVPLNTQTVTIGTDGTGTESFAALYYSTDSEQANTQGGTGTYYYIVKEQTPGNGFTAATSEHRIQVVITDDGSGTLQKAVTVDDRAWTEGTALGFINNYDAEGIFEVSGTKIVTGGRLAEFNFGLFGSQADAEERAAAKALAAATNSTATGSFTLTLPTTEAITMAAMKDESEAYVAEKEFTYYVSEISPDGAGYTASKEIYEVKITMQDNGNGTLSQDTSKTSITKAGNTTPVTSMTFTNAYNAEGIIAVTGTKEVTNGNLAAGFAFMVYKDGTTTPAANVVDAAGNPVSDATVSNNAAGAFSFGLKFTNEDLYDAQSGAYLTEKDFTYYIMENGTNMPGPGYTVDNSTYRLTVSVSNANLNTEDATKQALTVTQKSLQVIRSGEEDYASADSLVFTNNFTAAGTGVIAGKKNVAGGNLKAGFAFSIYEDEAMTTPATTVTEQTVANNGDNGEFQFDLAYEMEDMRDTENGGYLNEKTFTYYIKETSSNIDGYTTDSSVYKVELNVNLAGNVLTPGTQTISKLIGEDYQEIESGISFTNRYAATGETSISGVKNVENNNLSSFAFGIFEDEQGTIPAKNKEGEVIRAESSPTDGSFHFDLTYDMEDLRNGAAYDQEKPFTYYIRETSTTANKPGYEMDTTVYKVEVMVEDNTAGGLTVTKTVSQKAAGEAAYTGYTGDTIEFTNNYIPDDAAVSLTGTKLVEGGALKAFNFGIFDAEGNAIPADDTHVTNKTVTSDETTGGFQFDFTYTMDDLKDADGAGTGYAGERDFTYIIKEGDRLSGYAENLQQYKAVITVSNNDAAGTLTAELTSLETAEITDGTPQWTNAETMQFTNIYQAAGSAVLSAGKELTGKRAEAMQAGEFQFVAQRLTEGGTVDETADSSNGYNTPEGTITFEPILFNENDIGKTYKYKLTEIPGTDSAIQYSGQVYYAAIAITDTEAEDADQKSILQADVSYFSDAACTESLSEEEVVFGNEYRASGELSLSAEKILNGAALEEGAFTFELRDVNAAEDAEPLQRKTNSSEGTVTFDPISYTQEDIGEKYSYRVTETGGTLAGMTYDTTVYTVNVEVADSDASDGTLKITTEILTGETPAEQITFTNTFAGSATLTKAGPEGELLEGAQFQLYAQQTDGSYAAYASAASANGLYLTNAQGILEVTGLPAGNYYFVETQAPRGFVITKDANGEPLRYEFAITQGAEDVSAELSAVNEAGTEGSITVTKRTTAFEDNEFVNVYVNDAAFYVGLFTDAQGTRPYGTNNVKQIRMIDENTSEQVTFSGLPSGTYYVFETTAEGTAIPMNTLQTSDESEFMCMVDGENATNAVTLDLRAEAVAGAVNLNNLYYTLPSGFYYDGQLNITKKVLKNGEQTTEDDTFYAGIFTKDESGALALYKVVTLTQNGTVTENVPLGGTTGKEPVTYYVYETDSTGRQVDKNTFFYDVSGEGEVTVKAETPGEVTITNAYEETETETEIETETETKTEIETETETETSRTTTKIVKTGDVTPLKLFLVLFGLSAAALLIIMIDRRRRKKKN